MKKSNIILFIAFLIISLYLQFDYSYAEINFNKIHLIKEIFVIEFAMLSGIFLKKDLNFLKNL